MIDTLSRLTAALERRGGRALGSASACVTLVTVGFATTRTLGAGGDGAWFVVSQALWVLAVWASFAGSLLGWGASAGHEDRRLWTLFSAATLSLSVAGTYFSGYQVFVDPAGPSTLSVFDILGAAGALFLGWALFDRIRSTFRPGPAASTRLIDAAAIAVVLLVALHALSSWMLAGLDAGSVLGVADLAYILVGILVIVGVAGNAAGFGAYGWRAWQVALVATLGVYGVGVALWAIARRVTPLTGDPAAEIAAVTVILLAHALMLVAGVCRVLAGTSAGPERTGNASSHPDRPRAASLLLSSALLGATFVFGVLSLRAPEGSLDAGVFLAGMGSLGALTVVRSGIEGFRAGELRARAGSDQVTGLPNLRSIQARIAEAVGTYRRYGDPFSVLVFDLDDFERINTFYGRAEGDRLLREAAVALAQAAGPRASVGRIGGDEFAAVFDGLGPDEALAAATAMREALHAVLTSAGLPLTASWGIASCPRHALTGAELLKCADAAQYWAKRHGKDRVVVYDPREAGKLHADEHSFLFETRAELDVLLAVVVGSEARHAATRYHSRNVAALAVLVGEALGLAHDEVRDLEIAALLHDLGKVGVPDDVLFVTGSRPRASEALYRGHVELGERLVAATSLARIAPVVRAHHERWDGTGYPDGSSGASIPLGARIIAACDGFECMTAGRGDAVPLSRAAALHALDQGMATEYDPEVVEVLISVVADLPSEGWEPQRRSLA